MSFLPDTNVVSEWTKPRPNAGVVTFAELRRGIERSIASDRRRRLDEWVRGELSLRFEARIIGVDGAVADEWGRLVARGEARGRTLHAMAALIAATAQVHGLTLVTRNTADFEGSVKSLLDPWT